MKTPHNTRLRKICSGACFAVLLILLSASTCLHAGNPKSSKDSLPEKFALTDPRNPDCPCHKYQRQAEEEYAKLKSKRASPTPSEDGEVRKKSGTKEEERIRKEQEDHSVFSFWKSYVVKFYFRPRRNRGWRNTRHGLKIIRSHSDACSRW